MCIRDRLMIDSAEIAGLMNDSAFQQKLGYNKETLPCLFIPETYQVYWDKMCIRDRYNYVAPRPALLPAHVHNHQQMPFHA